MVGCSGLESYGDADEKRSGGRICETEMAAEGKEESMSMRCCGLIWASQTGLPDDSGGAAVGSSTDG